MCRSANADHFKLFVITGQSNSLGTTGGGETDVSPSWDIADAAVPFFWSNVADATTQIGNSRGSWTTLREQQGGYYPKNETHWGLEFGLARQLRRAGIGNFGIVKASRGGGGNTNWSKSNKGHMYRHVVQTVRNASSILKQKRHTFEVAALIYVQGESDTSQEANVADERLASLLKNLRNDLPHAKEMRLIVGGIAAAGNTRDIVRDKQLRLASQDRRVSYVDNFDLQNRLYDKLHFDKEAKLKVGRWLDAGKT